MTVFCVTLYESSFWFKNYGENIKILVNNQILGSKKRKKRIKKKKKTPYFFITSINGSINHSLLLLQCSLYLNCKMRNSMV